MNTGTSGLLTLLLGGLLFGQAEVLDLTKRIRPPDPRWSVGGFPC
jgi:hypothetical protein